MRPGHLHLRRPVLDTAMQFLVDRGANGLEGTGLIACELRKGSGWHAVRFVAPDQRAARTGGGCWVEVTETGKTELAAGLRTGERYLVRIHSHPGEAFHSPVDDANPALIHEGALSIVVPYFGLALRRGLDACAVLRRERGRWVDLPCGPERERWVRADG